MLAVIFMVVVAAAGISAETVPCMTGSAQCSGSVSSISIMNNEIYCCGPEFSQVAMGQGCTCVRQFISSDCFRGAANCHGATSLSHSSDGTTICCKNSTMMQHTSNSIINGVYTSESCKCRQFVSSGGVRTGSGVSRPMTDEEKAAYEQWEKNFTANMNQFSQGLEKQMSDLEKSLSHMFGAKK